MIKAYEGMEPNIDPTAFVAPGVVVIGDVTLGPQVNIWYGCVVRADVGPVSIGARTNLQDGTVVHIARYGKGTHLGEDVTVGHRALLHDCQIEDRAMIGMGAIVLDGAVVGQGAWVAAGAVVSPGTVIPPGMLAMGIPAKPIRKVREKEAQMRMEATERYLRVMEKHRRLFAQD